METKTLVGSVYLIHCEPHSDRYYIGATTTDLKRRWSLHKHDSFRIDRKGSHTPKSLWIREMLSRGLNIEIEKLDSFEHKEKNELTKILFYWEQFYIGLFKSWNVKLVNDTVGGGGFRKKHTSKTKELLAKIGVGRKRGKYNWTDDGISRIKEARKRSVGNYRHTQETKNKIGVKQTGGHNHRARKVFCIENGNTYPTLIIASKELGISEMQIRKSAMGRYKLRKPKYNFRYE